MKPTRRGFIGALGALIAAPSALISDAEPIDQTIKEYEPGPEWFPCDVDLIADDGEEIPIRAHYKTENGYTVGDATFAKIGEMTWKNHITIDCGTLDRTFGPIVAVRVSGTKVLPKGYIAEIFYPRVVNPGDGVQIDWDIETNF